jgi:hypothetical protein
VRGYVNKGGSQSCQHAFDIAKHVVVPKTNYAKAQDIEGRGSAYIASIVGMLSTIDLYDQTPFHAAEVRDKSFYWPLPAKF